MECFVSILEPSLGWFHWNHVDDMATNKPWGVDSDHFKGIK